jgi:hypothetical protein
VKTYVILRCLHGSHLYGLATPQSDYDYYEIYDFMNHRYRPRKQSDQRIKDDLDEVKISLDRFTDICFKGVPQAIEVLFSPPEAWIIENGWIDISAQIKDELKYNILTILETYRRTALKFFYSDKNIEKKRRHAFRLLINAKQLKTSGTMKPKLTEEQIKLINKLTASFCSEEKFKDMVYDTFEAGKGNGQ